MDKEFSTFCQATRRTPAPGYPETGVVQLQLQRIAYHAEGFFTTLCFFVVSTKPGALSLPGRCTFSAIRNLL